MLRRSHPSSRADELRRLLELYGSAEEALAAGNYYVAARRADAAPEVRAAAITLAGFHEGGHRLFQDLEPSGHHTLFAKAIACLFVEGRDAALACLDRYALTAGPAFALRDVLRRGAVRLYFVTAWQAWQERIAKAAENFDGHGLDVQVRTVSVHDGADIRVDFNRPSFLQAIEQSAADAAYAASIYFDDLDMLPMGFDRSAVPSIKLMIDFHHNLPRMAEQLGRFDHLVAYGPELHERLHRMYGRRTPMFMRLSDMKPVNALAGEDASIDIFLSGALVKDYSPRREALVHRCVEEIATDRVVLADGLLPFETYQGLVARARMIPAMLEEGNALPSPRFFEALNGGMTVVTDDPLFFAWAYPDHADLFVDVETAFRVATAPREAQPVQRRPRPRPRTELAAIDQMLHLALVGPLLAPENHVRQGRADAASPASLSGWSRAAQEFPRLSLNSNIVRQFAAASGSFSDVLTRALHLARHSAEPLAVLDSSRFFAELALAFSHFHQHSYHLQLEPGLKAELAVLAGPAAPDGGAPVPVRRNAATPQAVLMAAAALNLIAEGQARCPDSLILTYERLLQWKRFCGEDTMLADMVQAAQARRADLRYDPSVSDAGAVGAVLPDMLAREILAGRIETRADLAIRAEANIWYLIDLLGAGCAAAAGDTETAAAVVRHILAESPGYIPAADKLVEIWEVAPQAAYGKAGSASFLRQALSEVLLEAPSRIEGYGPALVAAALEEGDEAGARAHHAAWERWAYKLIMSPYRYEKRTESARRISEAMAAAGLVPG
ncbi:hypothetical protein ACFOGJ_16485 [Marinibaculum pumilum]|uniref:Glycosyltransferase family 1 protein n=1 Tax=Marinibaculum pumilum TaxID=1766165 RepID=A0ABV7L2S2_9PROT